MRGWSYEQTSEEAGLMNDNGRKKKTTQVAKDRGGKKQCED